MTLEDIVAFVSQLENVSLLLRITGGVLGFLILLFLLFFLLPGIVHWFRLRSIQRQLRKFAGRMPPGEFKKLFARDKRLAHIWREYQGSLHTQREMHEGQLAVAAVRSTVPAETYFSSHLVVDSRLHTEFFRHLPGIFTGVGIIGTFSGLIEGLSQFQAVDDTVTMRASLESLMHSVGEAFLVSAAAITAAMVVTFLEKLLLASLYRRTEEIASAIDARFDAGAGEEYLSRLVMASEDTASQSKILKDALVRDLGDLLREITAAQITASEKLHLQLVQRIDDATTKQVEASRADNVALSAAITESIRESLKAPLADIASTVKTASGDQSSAAIRMLNDVMVSFSQRLNDLFGGQINGITDLNKQTAQSVQEIVNTLKVLAANLEESGKKSTDEMAAKMAAAMEAMEERQGSINSQTQAFVEQIRKLVESSQAETQQKLQSTLEQLGQQMTSILASLGESQAAVFESSRAREQAMTERTQSAVSTMAGSVEAAVQEMTVASKTMAQSVSALSAATASSIDKMNAGAERLNAVLTGFGSAGDRVSSVMNQAANISANLAELSASLTTSAAAVQDALRDYRVQRDAVSQLLAEVRATVDLARKEASLTGDILQRIDASAEKLGAAQKAAEEYLDGIGEILANSSEAFRESVVTTLAKVNHDFHTKLSSATGLLSSAVQELEVTLGSFSPRR